MFSFVLKPKCNLENVSVANPGVVGGGREKERGQRVAQEELGKDRRQKIRGTSVQFSHSVM